MKSIKSFKGGFVVAQDEKGMYWVLGPGPGGLEDRPIVVREERFYMQAEYVARCMGS